jgi:oxygen-independent coproporphyrinogen III oxidase
LPRQQRIDASALPDQMQRFAMASAGFDQLRAAGYDAIGFDHFALPHDSMAVAARDGSLRRNFQGFTDDQAERLIGLGASAISGFPDRIIQNEKNAGRYRMRLSQDHLTGTLGVWRSPDERQRGMVIEDILCNRPADLESLAGPLPLDGLHPFLERGLIRMEGHQLRPTDASRPYARTMAALFDPYRTDTTRRFSSAV